MLDRGRARDGHEKAKPVRRDMIQSNRGMQFTSWAFSQRVRECRPGHVDGSCRHALRQCDGRVVPGTMQSELFNRKRWKTRIELGTGIHDSVELFHNTRVATAPSDCSRQPNTRTDTHKRTMPPNARTRLQTPGQIKVSAKQGDSESSRRHVRDLAAHRLRRATRLRASCMQLRVPTSSRAQLHSPKGGCGATATTS